MNSPAPSPMSWSPSALAARSAWLLLAVLAMACSLPRAHAASDVPVELSIRELLAGSGDREALWDLARWRDELTAVYVARAYAPLWFSNGRPTRAAQLLLTELA